MNGKKQPSIMAHTFTMVFVVFWIGLFSYPAAWHIATPDKLFRRYHFWRSNSRTIDDKVYPFADLWHMLTSPVHNAALKNKGERITRLAPGADQLNSFDSFGMTPLAYASMFGDIDTQKMLVAAGADPNIILGDGTTALHQALANREENAALFLLENKARVDIADRKGITPLHLTIKNNLKAAFMASLNAEANLSMPDNKELTPLDYAIQRNSFDMVQNLARAGANPVYSSVPKELLMKTFLTQWQKTGDYQQSLDYALEVAKKYPPNSPPAELPVDLKPTKPLFKSGEHLPDENL